jgi:hypothetical protein
MPRLNERKVEDAIPTYLRLPRTTRAELESAIDGERIKTLTDAMIEAAKLLAKQVKRKSSSPKRAQDPT